MRNKIAVAVAPCGCIAYACFEAPNQDDREDLIGLFVRGCSLEWREKLPMLGCEHSPQFPGLKERA